jgi:hypothetical protein
MGDTDRLSFVFLLAPWSLAPNENDERVTIDGASRDDIDERAQSVGRERFRASVDNTERT